MAALTQTRRAHPGSRRSCQPPGARKPCQGRAGGERSERNLDAAEHAGMLSGGASLKRDSRADGRRALCAKNGAVLTSLDAYGRLKQAHSLRHDLGTGESDPRSGGAGRSGVALPCAQVFGAATGGTGRRPRTLRAEPFRSVSPHSSPLTGHSRPLSSAARHSHRPCHRDPTVALQLTPARVPKRSYERGN